MGDTERASNDAMQRLQSSFGASSCFNLKQPLASSQQLDVNHMSISHGDAPVRHFTQHFGVESGKRVGMPPSHPGQFPPISPYSQLPASRQPPQALSFQNFGQGSSHSRSLSQPSFINLDSLPPLSPSPYRESSDQVSRDVTMGEKEAGSQNVLASSSSFMGVNYGFHAGESLPPRKTHRRSNSDSSAFGFSAMMESSLSLRPLDGSIPAQHNTNFGVANPGLVKSEFLWNADGYKNAEGMGERKSEGEVIDELFSTYMNLDSVETMNSSGSNDKLGNGHHESHHGGDTSDNETEGSINESGNGIATQGASDVIVKKEGMKRSATQDIAPATRHYRSVSMDSFMGNMNFAQDALKLPPSPSPRPLKLSPSTSLDSNSNTFSLEFGKGEFSGEELKKIMANEKLAEMALVDPKRVKRILANRQSAARSKERKMRYISELEHKVQTLQSETTTLSAQVTQLQRDSAALTSQNNELRFRLQAMEQQAKLRDALNETLHGEVQRLKLTTQQLGLNPRSSKDMANSQMPQIADPKQQENIPIAKEEVAD